MYFAILCQLGLLAYHQTTTLVDLYPFNGVRNASLSERFLEAGVNLVLMGLAPIGFTLGIPALMVYGVVYYFVLLFFELIIWWVPYFATPAGRWFTSYNLALSIATGQVGQQNALTEWASRHRRLHKGTVTLLNPGKGPIRPNLEHMILHGWTLITAVSTSAAFFELGPT